jgi:hypothetical protein
MRDIHKGNAVQRAALRAAAKLVISVVGLGCGGSVAGENVPPDANTPIYSDVITTDAAGAPATTDGNVAIEDAQASNECTGAGAVACCQALIHGTYPDAAAFPSEGDASSKIDPCCQTLETYYDHEENDSSFDAALPAAEWGNDGDLRLACCAALHWQGGATCDPWGPPVPPAMPTMLEVA